MKKGAYIFDNEQDYNAFRDAVYYKNSTLYYNVDKVFWYGYSEGKYRVNLNDKLIDDELEWYCPNCGNRNHDTLNVARRTCGYIGSNFWNKGRTQEIKERVLHL